MNLTRITPISLVVSSAFAAAYGNTLSLDTTFDGTGFTLQAAVPARAYSTGKWMAVHANRKTVIGGSAVLDMSAADIAVMRFNTDPKLDTPLHAAAGHEQTQPSKGYNFLPGNLRFSINN